MSNMSSLAGLSILVVDDDFYLAEDARNAFEAEGAIVLGPFSRAETALACAQEHRLDGAVVDLNLGGGLTFELTRALKQLGVRTIIVTGYDRGIIPPDLADMPCLHKPVEQTRLISLAQRLFSQSATTRQHDTVS